MVVLAAWFGSLEQRGLFIPDEGRYAEIPREMLASGDWITPRLNDLKYFEKPPLQYWMTAFSFRLLGEDEWTARLPSAALGLLALMMVGYTGYRLKGPQVGALAAAILGSSWGYFLAGQYLTLDMTLTACLTFALCAFLLAQREEDATPRNSWMAAAWAAAGFAVLSKGLIGVVLPAAALLAYVALRRETVLLRRLNPATGSVLLLSIAAPWFIAVQSRNPEFFDFFFIQEHFKRFAEPGHHRPGAWWYYIPVAILGLMPWTPALLREAMKWIAERRQRLAGFSPEWFCAAWAGAIVLFFSASQSKLPAYILPALPALALVLAGRLEVRGPDGLKWPAWGLALAGIAFIGLIPALAGFAKFAALGAEAIAQTPWLYGAAGTLLLSATAMLWSIRRRLMGPSVAILVGGTFAAWNFLFAYLHAIDANFSSERLIETLTADRKPFRPGVPMYSIAQFDHSVPFYLGRPVTLVEYRGELGSGIDAEPHKAIPTLERFEELWRAQQGDAYVILRPEMFLALRGKGLSMTQLLSDRRLVIASRRAGRADAIIVDAQADSPGDAGTR